jgi:sulfopyruvate decarboxylase alpha subunit
LQRKGPKQSWERRAPGWGSIVAKMRHPAAEQRDMSEPGSPAPTWPDEIFAVLRRSEIRQVGYVPDAGHARLIERCRAEPAMKAVVLTTEEEGIGLAAGAWLGGQRAALLMQSSGVGNCINMLSLAKSCRFPLLLLVTMRGEWAEFNPWQMPMGSITEASLRLCDVITHRVDEAASAAETVAAAADLAFNGDLAVAVLIGQRLIGRKRWVE